MSEYNTFLENVYSDENTPDWIDDISDVQRMVAEEGYQEFSIELEKELNEQAAWNGSKQFSGVHIKKACEHRTCSHFRCERSIRMGGIEI
jgi:hypothetical protein